MVIIGGIPFFVNGFREAAAVTKEKREGRSGR